MPLNFPDVYPNSEEMRFITMSQVFESKFDLTEQVGSLAGGKWGASQVFTNVSKTDARKLRALIVGLRGKLETVYFIPYEARTLGGTGSGTPLVNGASQSGNSLITDGWAASQTVLMAGDYFEVNGELKMVTSDVTSSGTGAATIQFEPDLRASPADGTAIIVNNPKCKMYLKNGDQAAWQLSQTQKCNATLEWVERF